MVDAGAVSGRGGRAGRGLVEGGIVATNETNQTNHSQWPQTSAGLHMRADATDAGRLVRLADVVLWLIESEGMPRIPAVHRLADELEAARFEPALFLVQAGDYAKQAEGDDATFGYHTLQSWAAVAIAQEIVADMRRDPWRFGLEGGRRLPDSQVIARVAKAKVAQGELPRTHPPADLVSAGVPALLRLLRKRWTWGRWPGVTSDAEAFTHPRLPGRAVAVRLTDAARIWGYGADWLPVAGADEASLFPLPDWAALVRYRTSYTQAGKRAPSWGLGNQLQTARAELERRQAGGASKTDAGDVMGRELGYQGNAPHKQLFKALFSERKKNPPAGGLESVVRHAVGKKQA